MRFTFTFKKFKMPVLALGVTFLLTSCGAYQYVGYDNDGIYSSDEVVVDTDEASTNRTNDNYYVNYFGEIAADAELAQEESGEIFTDIDSYSSDNPAGNEVEIIEDYGGWGQVNDQVTINYYNTGWNNWGWGWNDPWLWNGGFGWGWNAGFGWGWNNWRWNRWGIGFGWNNWGWSNFGWRGPGLGGWRVGVGYGWNNPYSFPYWNNGFGYYGNNLAYNRSRRGVSNRSIANVGRSRLSNRIGNISRRSGNYGTTRGTSSRPSRGTTTRPSRGIVGPSRGTTTRPSRGNTTRPSRGTTTRPSRGNTTRPSRGTTTRPSRSSSTRPSRGGSYSPSRGSSRSSGSMRSSGGSRSSSGSRSSGGSIGRRG